MTLILGIDPGSRITGYGVVQDTGRGCVYVASGCIRTGGGELHERLQIVYRGVREVIQTYGPVTMGIEKVFMARNADSALKLGQARGAAIVAGAEESLEIAEYSATQIKQAVAGTGGANKEQVMMILMRWRLLCAMRTPVPACCLMVWGRRAAVAGVCVSEQGLLA
jgi:crossover junction endodeoxyribonuclease RuvC